MVSQVEDERDGCGRPAADEVKDPVSIWIFLHLRPQHMANQGHGPGLVGCGSHPHEHLDASTHPHAAPGSPRFPARNKSSSTQPWPLGHNRQVHWPPSLLWDGQLHRRRQASGARDELHQTSRGQLSMLNTMASSRSCSFPSTCSPNHCLVQVFLRLVREDASSL